MLNRMGPATQQVFRQRSPLALAAMCAVVGIFLLVSLVRDWADNPQPLYVAWVLLGLALAWSVYFRPAVVLDEEGVTLRNIVRDVHIPWGRVTDIESRWNLKVFVGDRGYSAWAITSQVGRPRHVSGGILGVLSPGRLEKWAGVAAPPAPAPRVTGSMVARSIEKAKQEHDEAVAHGALPAAPNAGVRIRWVPLVLVVQLLPAIAVVVLLLT